MALYTKGVVAVLLAGLATPVTVTAQLSSLQFGVAAGTTFPQGDFLTGPCGLCEFSTGWQGMAFVGFRIRHSRVAFRLDGSYGANTSSEPINGVPTEDRVGLFGRDADLTFTFVSPSAPAQTKVYLLVGPGLYRVSHTVTQRGVTSSASGPTEFAYNLGGGINVGALFFEARYVHVDGFGNDVSYILVPITAGLRFGSW